MADQLALVGEDCLGTTTVYVDGAFCRCCCGHALCEANVNDGMLMTKAVCKRGAAASVEMRRYDVVMMIMSTTYVIVEARRCITVALAR